MQKNVVENNHNGFTHKRSTRLMGNNFEFSVLTEEEAYAVECFEAAIAEIKRIEKLLTTFDESSQTNLINRNAGICPVQVNKEVFDLIDRSLQLSAITQGAFDISYGSLDKRFWNFDLKMTSLPYRERAKAMVRLIDYRNIILDKKNSTVFLKNKGMRIGFGGIGKGYAAEEAKNLLKSKGITSGIVNAAGDLTTWGVQTNGKPYTIAIANPSAPEYPIATLNISDKAVATSGNYEKYVLINGRWYSHTIDPKTGYPVSGIKSVTIICNHAELADALATPVMVMGVEAGLYLINQMRGVGCVIIDDKDNIHISTNLSVK